MKRRLFSIFFLLSLVLIAPCAKAVNVTGKLLDANTKQAVDFANVVLTKVGESAPITGTTTDISGAFTLTDLKNGKYVVAFTFLGYSDQKKEITIQGKDVNLGTIYMREDSKQLEEVEVVAQGSQMRFELDKKVFSVDQSIASAGGSVTDVLENIPSVDVDQEGTISLRNSDAVEIWINGKPAGLTAENRAQILEQMPAGSVKEIEVITNPSAKYSPEGTAGIINLVMKKDRQAGYFGNVTAGIRYGLAAPWNIPPGGNLGLNFNFTKGIVDGYFNVGFRCHTSNGGNDTRRLIVNGTGEKEIEQTHPELIEKELIRDGQNDRRGGGFFARAGLNIHVTERSTIGISGFGIIEDSKCLRTYDNDLSTYTLYDYQTHNVLRQYTRRQTGGGWHPGGNAMIDYTLQLNKHRLQVSGAYYNFNFNQDNTYTQIEKLDTTIQQQITLNNDHSFQIKADYEWKPTQQSRLEAGYQGDLAYRSTAASANDIIGGEAMPIDAYYNQFANNEQNHALYITYGNRFFERLSLQVGLRGEYFMRHLSSTYYVGSSLETAEQDTAYFQLFPSAYLSYSFDNGHEIQLNYTRRVDRPRGHQINPRQDFSDSTNIRIGNPALLPQYSSALELNYLKSWDRHTLSAGLFYRFGDKVIQNVRYMEGSLMRNTYINIGKRHAAGLEIVGKNKLFKELLVLTTSLEFYYNGLQAIEYTPYVNGRALNSIVVPRQDIFAFSAKVNAQFMFTKTFSGNISARYRSPRVVAQGNSSHSYSIDLGLKKTFFEKKLALNLVVRDLLDSRARRNTTWGDGFWQYQQKRWHSRELRFTISYNFGTMKGKKDKEMNDGGSMMSSGEEDIE